jgi:hypothetical protein
MSKKVLICGSRDWIDPEPIRSWLCKLQDWGYTTLIEGEARGADSIARDEAEKMGFVVLKFPADWDKYHKAAGPIRNAQMLKEGTPELVVAFSKNIVESKGTKNMVDQAIKAGVSTIIVSK